MTKAEQMIYDYKLSQLKKPEEKKTWMSNLGKSHVWIIIFPIISFFLGIFWTLLKKNNKI